MAKPLTRAYTLNLLGLYEHGRFEELYVEDTDRFTAEASLAFMYRRFSLEAGYRYRVNDSEVEANDYVNNVLFINGTVRF